MKFMPKLSLRARLTFLIIGLLAFLLLIQGLVFYQDTEKLLLDETASNVRARAKPIIEQWVHKEIFRKCVRNEKDNKNSCLTYIALALAKNLTSKNAVAQIFDCNGHLLANGKTLPEEPEAAKIIPRYARLALKGKNEVTYFDRRGNIPFLVVLIPLRSPQKENRILGVAQISVTLRSLQQKLKRHGIFLVFVALVTLSSGIFLVLLIVSSSFQDLKQMAETCRGIAEGNLNLQFSHADRQDEIGQLIQAFNIMIEKIGEILDSQQRFVANAAHELRSPITALKGSLDILLRGVRDDPVASSRLLIGMHREVERLKNLCDRLLDLSRLEGIVTPQKTSVDLQEFFRDFFPQLQMIARERYIELLTGPRVSVMMDLNMLREMLFNLVMNAVQHTESNGKISIGWRLVSEPEGVQFTVEDNGEGISPHDLPKIFEPFYRGHKKEFEGKTSGAGLGLSIVKAITVIHNGNIKVHSVLNIGTKISIIIPFE